MAANFDKFANCAEIQIQLTIFKNQNTIQIQPNLTKSLHIAYITTSH